MGLGYAGDSGFATLTSTAFGVGWRGGTDGQAGIMQNPTHIDHRQQSGTYTHHEIIA